jgi:hypothetical protein
MKFLNLFGEDDPCQIIAVRILLPIEEVPFGFYLEGITQDRSSAMGCWSQSNDMGAHLNTTIIAIMGLMIKSDVERHRKVPTFEM